MNYMREKIVPLSPTAQAVILGSLLGDGSLKINKNYVNARFAFKHSRRQEAYFYWKANLLKEISAPNSVCAQKNDGYGGDKLRWQSRVSPSLTELYRLVSKKNQLKIRRKWLNHLTPLSLAIWWFDDGSIISNGRKGVFCTDGFDKKSVQILERYLEVVWKIKTKIGTIHKPNGTKTEYFRLWFRSTEELIKFLRLILPYAQVPEVLPKVLLLYKDNQLQERWISEIMAKTNFSRVIVEKFLSDKKSRWKKFRE